LAKYIKSIRLDSHEMEFVEVAARELNVSSSDVIREAIMLFLKSKNFESLRNKVMLFDLKEKSREDASKLFLLSRCKKRLYYMVKSGIPKKNVQTHIDKYLIPELVLSGYDEHKARKELNKVITPILELREQKNLITQRR